MATLAKGKRQRATYLGAERRRPMVLDAALAIAVERGVGAITIGAVADRLDVTRPVVYSCFPDRVSLIDALVEREHRQISSATLSALHRVRGQDPLAALTDGYRAFLQVVADHAAAWQLIFAAAPDAAVAEKFNEARRELTVETSRWIRPTLSRWWAIAELDRKLPVLVELFVSSCEAAVRSLLNPDLDWSAEELAELHARVIAHGMSIA